ncbi:MAG TPA: M23 family metallopeptidase [Marmoricola sp.]
MPAAPRRRVRARLLATTLLAATCLPVGLLQIPAVASAAVTTIDAPLPEYRVLPGTVLKPRPPRAPSYVRPVTGYRLTGRFADRGARWASRHTGLDFAVPAGTPIRSVGAGRVVRVGYAGSYGIRTVVRLARGTKVWYCHQRGTRVRVGERVHAGERIGSVGSTGNSTGPHLHLEVRTSKRRPVNPLRWLRTRGLCI